MWLILLFVFVVSMLWKYNDAAKYYLKFTFFAVFSVISTSCFIPLMLANPRSPKNALLPAAALRFCAKYILGLKCSVIGKENIVKDSGCVVVINHQSSVDLIVLAELWPVMDRCAVISKKEIFYIWPFGLAAWLWGTIYIDRLNGAKARDTINKTGEIINNRKARVLMFPEGTRSLKNELLPFKKGAFHVAIASQCPIQPVTVSPYTFLGSNRFDSGNLVIEILPAIPTKGMVGEDIMKLIDKTHEVMQKNVYAMKEKTTTPNNNVDESKTPQTD